MAESSENNNSGLSFTIVNDNSIIENVCIENQTGASIKFTQKNNSKANNISFNDSQLTLEYTSEDSEVNNMSFNNIVGNISVQSTNSETGNVTVKGHSKTKMCDASNYGSASSDRINTHNESNKKSQGETPVIINDEDSSNEQQQQVKTAVENEFNFTAGQCEGVSNNVNETEQPYQSDVDKSATFVKQVFVSSLQQQKMECQNKKQDVKVEQLPKTKSNTQDTSEEDQSSKIKPMVSSIEGQNNTQDVKVEQLQQTNSNTSDTAEEDQTSKRRSMGSSIGGQNNTQEFEVEQLQATNSNRSDTEEEDQSSQRQSMVSSIEGQDNAQENAVEQFLQTNEGAGSFDEPIIMEEQGCDSIHELHSSPFLYPF